MTDPVTLGVVVSWVTLEGIKFLYGQASELLKAWRQQRHDVPVAQSSALDRAPQQRPVNTAVLAQEADTLRGIVGTLAPYAEEMADITPGDAGLAERADQVRVILEAVYGQRFTFKGEQRDPTGTTVTVHQALGRIAGVVVGVEADARPGVTVQVEQIATSVEQGGSMTGYKGGIGSS